MQVFPYSPSMRIVNTNQLPQGTGAKYLEVSTVNAKEGELIAVQWRRTKPKSLPNNHALVQFK